MSTKRVTRSKKRGSLPAPKRQRIPEAELLPSEGSDDDIATDLLILMSSMRQKKTTPKRRKKNANASNIFNDLAFKRHWHSDTGCPCMLSTTVRPSKAAKKPTKSRAKKSKESSAAGPSTSTVDVDLPSDEGTKKTDENPTVPDEQVNNIKSKLDSFFKCIESSDEEEIELKVNVDKNQEPVPRREKDFYEILSDSDDVAVSEEKSNTEVICEASTSCMNNSSKDISFSLPKKSSETESKSEDLMAIVEDIIKNDDVVDVSEVEQKKNDARLLEVYKKETEEMLNSVSSLINGLCKSHEKKEVAKPPETKSCPICLEEIGSERPAMATFCGHLFCQECITHVARTTKKCPTCRKAVGLKKIHPVYL